MSDTEFKNKVQKMEEDASKIKNRVITWGASTLVTLAGLFAWWTVSEIGEVKLNLAKDGRFTSVDARDMKLEIIEKINEAEHRTGQDIIQLGKELREQIDKKHD